MTELNDHELLAQYASTQSEAAFSTLVERYVNLVYSAALRFAGNPHHAQEITQAVFIVLSRKAGSLRSGTVLSGWLYETARLTASNFVKGEIRRQNREQEAYMQSTLTETESASWKQIAPLLDEAMGCLGETDRNAIVLRFFENKTAREVGVNLKLNEEAAHKRVNRALEKLRKYFVKRGVTLSATFIAGAVAANSVQAAPVGLAVTVSATAVKGTAVAASTLTLAKGVLKAMAWTKTKMAVVAGLATLLSAGTSIVAVKAVDSARTKAALATMKGDWEGTLDANQQRQRLVLKVFETNGNYHATFDFVERGARDITINKLSARPDSIRAEMTGLQVNYQAVISADGKQMSGVWKQLPNHSTPLVLKRTDKADRLEKMATSEYAARPGSDLQGAWEGVLKNGDTEMRVGLRIAESKEGTFRAQLDERETGYGNIPIPLFTYRKPTVRFELSSFNIVFEGNLNVQGDQMTGKWIKPAETYLATFRRLKEEDEKDFAYQNSNQIQGHWKGTLETKNNLRHLVFNVARMPDGSYSATMDSPDVGAAGIPASTAQFIYPNLRLEWKTMGGIFTGKLENGKISGEWKQANVTIQMLLTRDAY